MKAFAARALRRATRVAPIPLLLWRRHAALARRAGLDRFYVLLSFDCDTDKDIEVAPRVAERLRELGIAATFAVPGEQLRRGRETYRALAGAGHEFIAHGDHEHCALRGGEYVSSFFYDQLDRATIADDIARATTTYEDVFGHAPLGFRVPHFGSFQSAEQLGYLHDTLEGQRYRFSSSTMPLYGLRRGPAPRVRERLREVPLSGCFSAPLSVLDSYGFRFAPRHASSERYEYELTGTVGAFAELRWPGLLNTYADPSQVYDFAPFWHAIEFVAKREVPTLSYSRLLELVA